MASGIYDKFKSNLFSKAVNCSSGGDTFLVALANSDHAFTATHINYASVSANCIASGGGYTTGGAELAGIAISGTSTQTWDATDTVWGDSTFTANHAIIYMSSAGNLVASLDFGGAKVVASGTFTIQWSAAGIIAIA